MFVLGVIIDACVSQAQFVRVSNPALSSLTQKKPSPDEHFHQ